MEGCSDILFCVHASCFAAFGIMPFLKGSIGTMLPMLGGARTEQLKWSMAYGEFASFSSLLFLPDIECAEKRQTLQVLCTVRSRAPTEHDTVYTHVMVAHLLRFGSQKVHGVAITWVRSSRSFFAIFF